MWENTIVLFLADHGDMMGGHGMTRKGTMPYEELYNVPCIMKLPGHGKRKRSALMRSSFRPTCPGALLELAGVERLAAIQ
jgi:arylsulfatase